MRWTIQDTRPKVASRDPLHQSLRPMVLEETLSCGVATMALARSQVDLTTTTLLHSMIGDEETQGIRWVSFPSRFASCLAC